MSFWENKRVLVTGHTGFKGSWLCLWLKKSGASVTGYALEPPTKPNLFETAGVENDMESYIGDIRDKDMLGGIIDKCRPEIVFHLAAQSLVRESYLSPSETFEVNVLGTAYLLDCLRKSDSVRVIVNVTSDKCYENKEWVWGYRETDSMGGSDPYSCSKSCSEMVTDSFRKSFYNNSGIYLSTARAGNVIGGGDWARNRLVPDIINALTKNRQFVIRNPYAVRPWQHVLEPLNGYMLLAEMMWKDGINYSGPWNFGPDDNHIIDVETLVKKFIDTWEANLSIITDKKDGMHESQILRLDSSKAKTKLGWKTKFNINDSIRLTVEWYKDYFGGKNMHLSCLKEISDYGRLE